MQISSARPVSLWPGLSRSSPLPHLQPRTKSEFIAVPRWLLVIMTQSVSTNSEHIEFLLPPRGSNVTDIITNTLGAFCGALLARPRIVRAFLERTQWRRKAAEKLSAQPNS